MPVAHWEHLRTNVIGWSAVGNALKKLEVKSLSPGVFRDALIDAIKSNEVQGEDARCFGKLVSLDWTSAGTTSGNQMSWHQLRLLSVLSLGTWNLRVLKLGYGPDYKKELFKKELGWFFDSDPRIECLTILCLRYHDREGVKKMLQGVANCSHLRAFKFGTFKDRKRNYRYNDKETLQNFYKVVERNTHFTSLMWWKRKYILISYRRHIWTLWMLMSEWRTGRYRISRNGNCTWQGNLNGYAS